MLLVQFFLVLYFTLYVDSKDCIFNVTTACSHANKYSELDGSCNNLYNSNQAKTKTPYKRILPPAYEDKKNSPRSLDKQRNLLPNPRTLSRALSQDNKELDIWTHVFATFGQFITHDMSQVSEGSETCTCDSKSTECMNIHLPRNDPLKQKCLPFVRSTPTVDFSCRSDQREQLNLATPILDASHVYGKTREESLKLRTLYGGLLASTNGVAHRRPYLPRLDETCSAFNNPKMKCFKSGDDRTTQNLALTTMHTMFLREHNRIAGALARINKHWNDDRLFYESRRIMIAVYQHIIYDQYIASVIGADGNKEFDLDPTNSTYFYGYDSSVNPSLYNEFVAAAMRFGHTVVNNEFARFTSKNTLMDTDLTLSRINFKVEEAYNYKKGGLETILMGLVNSNASMFDMSIADDLQNKLMDEPNSLPIDLAAFNINRGRDHGIQPYVKYLEYCTGKVVKTFDDLLNITEDANLEKLRQAYKNVEDIDLWVGGLAEIVVGEDDVLTGPTFTCILGKQFSELKRGDRFYYENAPDRNKGTASTAFSLTQLKEIKKITLSTLLCNSFEITSIQRNVFFVVGDPIIPDNERKLCSRYSQMNFNKWKEEIDSDSDSNERK